MAKSLTLLSVSAKNIMRLRRFILPARFYAHDTKFKEINDQSGDVMATSKQLHDLLNNDVSPPSLVATILKNKDLFNSNHVIHALALMHKYYKENNVLISMIHKSNDFVQLCEILKSQLTCLNMNQATEALKILNKLRVPSSTMIMQSILQIIRCSINDLALNQVYFLTFLLEKMEETPLTKAILWALPEVFMAHIHLQLDKDDLKELSSALIYASKYIKDEEIIEFVLDATDGNYEPLDLDSGLKIFWALGDINSSSDSYRSLLLRCKEFLIQDSKPDTSLDGAKIFRTLAVIADKVYERKDYFYDSIMVHNLTNRFLDFDYGLEQRLVILNKLTKINHVCLPLLDHILWQIQEDPDSLSRCNPFAISVLVRAMAMADYKPKCWDQIEGLIFKNSARIKDTINLFHLALDLTSLGSYHSDLLKLAFSEFHSPELIAEKSLCVLKELYQGVKTLHTEYKGPWPSESMIKSFKALKHHHEIDNRLFFSALEKIFGCSSLIKPNVQTNLGHYIDFLVVLQDGIPLALKSKHLETCSNTSYVEDLDIPSACERMAIVLVPPSAYSRNVKILGSRFAMKIKSLEAMSYTVVPVPVPIWMEAPGWERLPYLRHLIGKPLQKKKEA